MLTADKAKLKSEKVRIALLDKERRKIEKHIQDAISYGCFSITRAGLIDPDVKKHFEELGYVVKTKSAFNDVYYTISWGED